MLVRRLNFRQFLVRIKFSPNVKLRHFCQSSEVKRTFRISAIEVIKPKKLVQISDRENVKYEFPFVWLRDNCQCSACFHPGSNSRTINWEAFDVDTYPCDVKLNDDSNHIKVTWSDGHESIYNGDWLKARNFSEENRENYLKQFYRPEQKHWGRRDFRAILKSFEFRKILEDNDTLYDWLYTLSVYGTAMIKNTPSTEDECRKLANRVGFIRKTHYGEEFIVKAKEGTTNVAYLSSTLQMHTDLPYYDYKPGCNLLHCIVQAKSKGGDNLLTDGFYVADLMRLNFPEYYNVLCETIVNWSDIGQEDENSFHSIYRAPVICLGRNGKLERINHSVPQRDSFLNIPIENVEIWYRAMKKFVEITYQEAFIFKTDPGDILTFNNIRLIHGRTGYTDTIDNSRYIVGAYLDWDEIYSRLRVLKKILNK